jgi:AhpD family alkylhydroperoxidase
MDAHIKGLVAVGASAAANCHPCLEHHLAECDKLKIPRDEVLDAVRVGLMVNHGAERAIRKHSRKLLGEIAADLMM